MGELGLRRFLALCVPPATAIAMADDYAADDRTVSKPTVDAQHMGRWVILWRSELAAMTFARMVNRCGDADVQVAQEDAFSVVVMGLDQSAARTYATAVLADVRRGAGLATRPRP